MNFDYQSGLIYSKEKFRYGHFEIRFKTDAASGHWPAFWLFGGDGQEIDIFEMGAGKLNEVHVDVHCKGIYKLQIGSDSQISQIELEMP